MKNSQATAVKKPAGKQGQQKTYNKTCYNFLCLEIASKGIPDNKKEKPVKKNTGKFFNKSIGFHFR